MADEAGFVTVDRRRHKASDRKSNPYVILRGGVPHTSPREISRQINEHLDKVMSDTSDPHARAFAAQIRSVGCARLHQDGAPINILRLFLKSKRACAYYIDQRDITLGDTTYRVELPYNQLQQALDHEAAAAPPRFNRQTPIVTTEPPQTTASLRSTVPNATSAAIGPSHPAASYARAAGAGGPAQAPPTSTSDPAGSTTTAAAHTTTTTTRTRAAATAPTEPGTPAAPTYQGHASAAAAPPRPEGHLHDLIMGFTADHREIVDNYRQLLNDTISLTRSALETMINEFMQRTLPSGIYSLLREILPPEIPLHRPPHAPEAQPATLPSTPTPSTSPPDADAAQGQAAPAGLLGPDPSDMGSPQGMPARTPPTPPTHLDDRDPRAAPAAHPYASAAQPATLPSTPTPSTSSPDANAAQAAPAGEHTLNERITSASGRKLVRIDQDVTITASAYSSPSTNSAGDTQHQAAAPAPTTQPAPTHVHPRRPSHTQLTDAQDDPDLRRALELSVQEEESERHKWQSIWNEANAAALQNPEMGLTLAPIHLTTASGECGFSSLELCAVAARWQLTNPRLDGAPPNLLTTTPSLNERIQSANRIRTGIVEAIRSRADDLLAQQGARDMGLLGEDTDGTTETLLSRLTTVQNASAYACELAIAFGSPHLRARISIFTLEDRRVRLLRTFNPSDPLFGAPPAPAAPHPDIINLSILHLPDSNHYLPLLPTYIARAIAPPSPATDPPSQ